MNWKITFALTALAVAAPSLFAQEAIEIAPKKQPVASNDIQTPTQPQTNHPTPPEGYKLAWADEFNIDGAPDPKNWVFEKGFVRNEETQYYQADNARCKDGVLVIEAREEKVKNERYREGSRDWRRKNEFSQYTSACIKTSGRHTWTYGQFEIRAKIDAADGMWPAIWTLGTVGGWPGCGEIDIMEYYEGQILANYLRAGPDGRSQVWDSTKTKLEKLGDENWSKQWHVWKMDWNETTVTISVDDVVLNSADIEWADYANGENPFREPHYFLLNLAMGGTRGGDPSKTKFPSKFEIDYVRVFQKIKPKAPQEIQTEATESK